MKLTPGYSQEQLIKDYKLVIAMHEETQGYDIDKGRVKETHSTVSELREIIKNNIQAEGLQEIFKKYKTLWLLKKCFPDITYVISNPYIGMDFIKNTPIGKLQEHYSPNQTQKLKTDLLKRHVKGRGNKNIKSELLHQIFNLD